MSERWWQDVERDPVHARAAEWFVRLDDPQVSFEETLEWQRWMEQDPRHEAAFARIEALGSELQRVPRPDIGLADPAVVPSKIRKTNPYIWLATAASVALIAVALSWWYPVGKHVQTVIGQNRTLALDDGSSITLGGNTRLRVQFSQEHRLIELSQGEAFFTVAKDPVRPFQVRAGTAAVTAIGTSFNVRRNDDRVVVAVLDGRVAVESQAAPTAKVISLDHGQQTTIDEKGVGATAALPDVTTATGWQAGRLIFRNEPLRYVIEDVNRYTHKPLRLADKNIGELKFTGTVSNDNVAGWIASLNSVFGLESTEEPERIVLRRPQ